jgi:hypothetical protein
MVTNGNAQLPQTLPPMRHIVRGLRIVIQLGLTYQTAVTLNLFQGPFILSSSGRVARWMLKQVQHDEEIGCRVVLS